MLIKDMFAKPIDRDIKGVIKVGQAADENVKQELEEYVVTKELQTHFRDFFAAYRKGIHGNTDKMGVWISGFFGSGKSHFLKILSYLLENKEVGGKRAIDYFIDDNKVIDPMVLADIKLAASVPTDAILFNIDSKSEMVGKHKKDAIVSVFLKVFNEMQGFCGSIPALADLERQLSKQNKYEEFKDRFQDVYGRPWLESRNRFDFIQDTVVGVLVGIGFMSEAAARNWCRKSVEPYQISIENFAKIVKEYLDEKDPDHHLVFLADEVGQYIGDNSQLMLNLQTVTEDLGTACHGKVWVIVTSQQDIDSITETKGNDFSKISGRFDTRLSLSAANVDEVVRQRILKKNTTAEQTLRVLYEQKSTVIKNLIVFRDGVEKKLYADEDDFAAVYPFVPYQFNLLGSVLTSIRTHGASGKHLSEGERSMLALFQESAIRLMDREHGVLVPFDMFYDALHQFLDHSHKGVISGAANNSRINPSGEEDCFNVNVLKVLFMIKYVKEITANVDNITSLMISDIDTDRIALKERVEQALDILVGQMLVQKNGEIYVFLTDEEQEINRKIESQHVETSEVISKVSEVIFEDIFKERKYRYPEHGGRYNFAFNQYVDGHHHGRMQNHDIGIRIITPASDYPADETSLRMMSGQNNEVLVVLPNDSTFLQEQRRALKIEKYLRSDEANKLARFLEIREAKNIELTEKKDNARLFLKESVQNAVIYVNGDRAQIRAKDVTSRINEALGRLVSTVYHKLSYIEVSMNETDIRALFKSSNQQSLTLDGGREVNTLAFHDVLSYIADNTAIHSMISMKSIMNRFMKAPYGFVEDDVEWLVARLFKSGEVSLTVSGTAITLYNRKSDEIINYITKRGYVEKLLIEQRQRVGIEEKKAARDVMKELFGVSGINDDDDSMMQLLQEHSGKLMDELKRLQVLYEQQDYPGEKTVTTGMIFMQELIQAQSPPEFYKIVYSERDRLLDFAEDFELVERFFAGEQRGIFENALRLMAIYDESKTFIVDEKVEKHVEDVREVLGKQAPYSDIPRLPGLLDQFKEAYMAVLTKMEAPILEAIKDARARVLEVLDTKPYKAEYKERYFELFEEIRDKAMTCKNVATLQNTRLEADALKIRLLNEMDKRDLKVAEEKDDYRGGGTVIKPPVKKRKNISIRDVCRASSWQIEAPEDLDKYMNDLRERILEELDGDTIISVEL